jgi:hypothetical protein
MSQTVQELITTPRIEAPGESLADESVVVRVTGLAPGAVVSVRSRFRDDFDSWWEEINEFRADDQGTVDLSA